MVTNKGELIALKEIANQKIERIFDVLNIDYEEKYKYITAPCPIHGGDRRDGFSWHLDYGTFQCFTRGCHSKYGKDIYGLVRGVLDCTFPDAVKFVKDAVGPDVNGDMAQATEIKDNKNFLYRESLLEVKIYPESMLERLKYNSYLESRGYDRELVEAYQAGVPSMNYGQMSNRIIFPVRDIKGSIVGFTGRTLYEDWKERGIGKWEHSAGFDKSRNLFNIDSASHFIGQLGVAIICEGPLDVLRLEQAGIKNGVGIFGRKLHDGQLALLMQAGANKLVIALDADDAGRSGASTSMLAAQSFFSMQVVDLGDGDIGDLTPEEARRIFDEANKR